MPQNLHVFGTGSHHNYFHYENQIDIRIPDLHDNTRTNEVSTDKCLVPENQMLYEDPTDFGAEIYARHPRQARPLFPGRNRHRRDEPQP